MSEIQLPTQLLPITSLLTETLNKDAISNAYFSNCISIAETASKKWVGLTRRVAAIEQGHYPDDTEFCGIREKFVNYSMLR